MKKGFIVALLCLFAFSQVNGQALVQTHTKIPGVMTTSSGYAGILADLYVEIHEGTGRTFVDTMPLTEVDTQAGARLAREVSCDLIESVADSIVKDCSNYDFMYIIRSENPMIGGPSAGGAMTIATIAAMLNKTLDETVVMTGTINPDGSIGPIGGTLEKAQAVYENGGSYFLIPKGQSLVYITESEISSGLYITEETKPVDLIEYAKSNWDLNVVEVSYVEDALPYFIGYTIEKKEVGSIEFATEQYTNSMKKMADKLAVITEKNVRQLSETINSTSFDVQESLLASQWLTIESTHLNEAKQLYENKQYYSASSRYVLTASNSLYYTKLIEYDNNENKDEFISNYINTISDEVNSAELLIEGNIDSIYDIEILTVAFDRIKEAINLVKEANQSYKISDYVNAIGYSSLASIRKETSLIWENITEDFTGNLSLVFDQDKIEALAVDRLELARSAVTYASLLTVGSFLNYASEGISNAEEAIFYNNYVFGLFEAIESRANANLAMELRDVTEELLPDKINKKKEDAVYAINLAEKEGYFPILALSYLEYGNDFIDESPELALQFFAYSKEFAEITNELSKALQPGEESDTGSNTTIVPSNVKGETLNETVIFSFILGFGIGLALSLIKIGI